MIGLVMFAVALLLLLVGFPVAFTFGGVAVFFGLLAEGPEIFSLMPHRIWSIMNNTILMAIPLFIFMGIVLQKSNLAERLLESMGFLFGEIRGGIAISTILVRIHRCSRCKRGCHGRDLPAGDAQVQL
jgi:TRAP-type mannitol/chloroaromatic compound transport system permease large subunit